MKNPERFQMRVSPEFTDLLDEWRRRQPEIPSRAESIRRLVNSGYIFDSAEVNDLIAELLELASYDKDSDKFSSVKSRLAGIINRMDRIYKSGDPNLVVTEASEEESARELRKKIRSVLRESQNQ